MKIQGITTDRMEGICTETTEQNKTEEVLQVLKAKDYDIYTPSQKEPQKASTEGVIYDTEFLKSMGIHVPDGKGVHLVGNQELLEQMQKDYHAKNAFTEYSGKQWAVFCDQLKESGLYQEQFGQKLMQITASMDSFRQYYERFHGDNVDDVYAQVTYKGQLGAVSYQDWFYMGKEQWQGQLSKAKEELQKFCEEYLPEDQRGDFTKLIDTFFEQNESLLKDYHALGEDSAKATLFEAMQTKDSVVELVDDIERLLQDILAQMAEKESSQLAAPTEDKKKANTYIDALKAYFTQVASSQGVATTGLEEHPNGDNQIQKKLAQEMWKEDKLKEIQNYWNTIANSYKAGRQSAGPDGTLTAVEDSSHEK